MEDFYSRIEKLRGELTDAIINTLHRHGLDRLDIPDDYEEPTYVMWVDDDGNAYDCSVKTVTIEKIGIRLDIEDKDGVKATIYSRCYDVGCRHVEWLAGILNMLEDLLGGSEDNMDAGEEQ